MPENPPREVANVVDRDIEVREFKFQLFYYVFGKIPWGKAWTLLSLQLWVEWYDYCSTEMDLALNNP